MCTAISLVKIPWRTLQQQFGTILWLKSISCNYISLSMASPSQSYTTNVKCSLMCNVRELLHYTLEGPSFKHWGYWFQFKLCWSYGALRQKILHAVTASDHHLSTKIIYINGLLFGCIQVYLTLITPKYDTSREFFTVCACLPVEMAWCLAAHKLVRHFPLRHKFPGNMRAKTEGLDNI